MYFPTSVTLAVLPFLAAGAVSVQNSLRDVVSIPLSKRSTFHAHNNDGLVDITGLQANIYHTMANYQRGFEAFEKNTGKRHPLASKLEHSDKRSASINIRATVPPVHDDRGSIWYGYVWVGLPPVRFYVLLDTGSADLFIPGPNCKSCPGSKVYDPSESVAATDLKRPFSVSDPLGSGLVNGSLYQDVVFVGGVEAAGQTLGVASNMSYIFNYKILGYDGILGLGFKSLSAIHADPLIQTLINETRVQESVFGLTLAELGPELIVGGRNSRLYNGNLTCLVVDTPAYWQTKFDEIAVNGETIQLAVGSTKSAIINTGTTQVIGDRDSIVNFYKQIPDSAPTTKGGQFWSIPCNTTVNASIDFGGTTFKISPDTFNLGPMASDSDSCMGGFAAAPTHSAFKFWTIGSVFLQNVYTEFDVGNLQVCFAPRAVR